MNNRLSHLNEGQIEELIQRYYSNEKISDLIKEYDINIQPSQLVKEFPPKIIDMLCPYCEVNMVLYYQSKTYTRFIKTPQCSSCGHADIDPCRCQNCVANRKQVQLELQRNKELEVKIILNNMNCENIELSSLSLVEKVYLGAFVREGISENFNYILPLNFFTNRLSPTELLEGEILKVLTNKNRELIIISNESEIEAFTDVNVETGSLSYHTHSVSWRINVIDNLPKVRLIDCIINPKDEYYSPEELYEIWKKIALHECLDYLVYSVKNVLGVDHVIGEKTISVLNDLLDNYSASQIYGIIYKAVGDALRFKVEKGVNSRHAANAVITKAQSYGERALIYKWDLNKFSRKECPITVVSKFFFERILKIGEKGFYEKPVVTL